MLWWVVAQLQHQARVDRQTQMLKDAQEMGQMSNFQQKIMEVLGLTDDKQETPSRYGLGVLYRGWCATLYRLVCYSIDGGVLLYRGWCATL